MAFCARVHAAEPGLGICHADAMALPFAAGSFDVVLNVESAHCCPEPAPSSAEVFRGLGPGGHLLMADLTPPRTRPQTEQIRSAADLSRTHFAPPDLPDITAAILAAPDRDHDRPSREIDRRFPLGTGRLARLRAGTPDSWTIATSPRGGGPISCSASRNP